MVSRGVVPDILTDQTSAHDALNGYVPNGMSLEEALALRAQRSGRIHRALDAIDGRACGSHARFAEARRDHFRLREQHSHPGEKGRRRKRVRYSRFRSGIYSSAFLRRERAIPLGRLERRSRRHRADRQARAGTFPEERNPRALDEAGAGANSFSGIAGAHLLAGLRRTGGVWRGHE